MPHRLAARHMLWMEAYAACLCCAIGFIAGWGEGALTAALQYSEPWKGLEQSYWWGGIYMGLGVLLLASAFTEMFFGRSWDPHRIKLAADVRCLLDSSLTIINAALVGQLLWTQHFHIWAIPVATITAVFMARATYVARRLAIALDERKYTPGLDQVIRSGL